MEQLRVVVKEPQNAKEKEMLIDHSNEAIQKIVGGYYEAFSHPELEGVVILCNENGKLQGLEQNIWMENLGFGGEWVVGNIIFVGYDGEGEFVNLTDRQIEDITTFIWD